MSYFAPYGHSKHEIKNDLDLSSYATKSDLKNATGIDTLQFSKKDDLANLKSEVDKTDVDELRNVLSDLNSLINNVDKLDVDKSKPIPVDLKRSSDVLKSEIVKKTIYDELVEKVNVIDASKFVNKTDYDARIRDIAVKIPSITGLATTTVLSAVENEIPKVRDLVKKRDYDVKTKRH